LFYDIFMENKLKIFARGVEKARKNKNWSQAKLAAKIKGGNQGTISSWLRGRTKFPEKRMNEFANVFGLTIEEILQIGRDEIGETKNNNVFKLNDPLEAEHLSIIRKFKNKHMACTLNELLVELEALDDSELACVVADVKNKIKTLKSSKKRAANGED